MSEHKRETTFEERARWGKCPTCQAPHGTWCYADVGLQVGSKINGARMVDGEGAHVSRLKAAPVLVDNRTRRLKLNPKPNDGH